MAYYRHPLLEYVYDVYMRYWEGTTLTINYRSRFLIYKKALAKKLNDNI